MADPAYIVDGVLTDGEAWVGIATTTLGSATTTVTFTSTDDGQVGDWSQYMDLVIVGYLRNDGSSSGNSQANFNNDTGSNYADQEFWANGSSAGASVYASTTNIDLGRSTNATNVCSAFVTHLFDINSGKYKSTTTVSANDQDGSGNVVLSTGTWKSQAPISEIDITYSTGDDLDTGSMLSLFGVLPRMVA
jgi:hypothetical protein